MSLSAEETKKIQQRKRAELALKLCIVMMVSDRDIHDAELAEIFSLLSEDDFFKGLYLDEEALVDLIGEIQEERVNLGLHALIEKYAKVSHDETREHIKKFMSKVMAADGIHHDKEIDTLKILENIWYN
tara:strand:- start:1 stop:387 length:387 start_codon:yes stop_codon:yes gene_type:complete